MEQHIPHLRRADDNMSTGSLTGQSILITGGGSGLGAALGTLLAEAGAHIMVGDRDSERAKRVADSLCSSGARAHALSFDVGDPQAAEEAVATTVSTFGSIDILINNAGTDVTQSIAELSFDDWDRVIRTNLHGPFLLSKFAALQMKQNKRGQIVNIASTASKRAWPNASAYHASKWGLLGLSNALHAELRPFGIKVTAVLAGGMRTPFLLDRFPDIDVTTLQDPANVAQAVRSILTLPPETVIPEVMVLPMRETSWP